MGKEINTLSVCSKERMVKESILNEGLPDINSLFSFGLSTTTMSIDLEDSCWLTTYDDSEERKFLLNEFGFKGKLKLLSVKEQNKLLLTIISNDRTNSLPTIKRKRL
ncbi:hypothetical protein JZU38_004547 [Salmonella enterica subsp. enterica serovar Senftenberg]|uniref:hypothetical protein n=1 Tax=Salmonella enterica TaxID=28901 RepID=UPI00109DAC32|nr:hypothetical protein [Salmonella enterica]EHF3701648.1 hypothetical protein [Salmonella enterica subsp. enterica serovar Senftenberg]EKQ4639796.1 hypothetical protein [Salmonella enterica subsp. enterica serovar Bietri]EBP2436712.1 hypothetical protein [Salmonella enterica]ECJ6409278.1 hypothetical protein [Salmonella enterica]ECJ6449768.1 hypothetical protein [Salmonella enterica]